MHTFKRLLPQFSRLFSKREKRKETRRFLLEQLSDRRLLASDVTTHYEEVSSPIAIHAEDRSVASNEKHIIEHQLSFTIRDAQKISLAYGNSVDDAGESIFLFELTELDLKKTFSLSTDSNVQWNVLVSNPAVYSVLPSVEADRLLFEVSGKEGLQAESSILVRGNFGTKEFVNLLSIDIDNALPKV